MSKYTHFSISSYLLFCLQSLHNTNIDHPYILDILYNYYVSNQGKIVNICRIPSHISIHGNNEADKAAKSALEFVFIFFIFMSVRWDVQWCPASKISTPLEHKRPFRWISIKRRLVRAAKETSRFLKVHMKRYSVQIQIQTGLN